MSKLRAAIIVFLGTNCDRDTKFALDATGFRADYVFHTEQNLEKYDLIVLPGGFSFGDYTGAGRLAKLSPSVTALNKYIGKKFILGICNGFQILCEAGLLPGALITNTSTKFIARDEKLILESSKEEITLPIAHKEGLFWADEADLKRIEAEKLPFIRYKTNPNGSLNDIAGLYDKKNKVMALMPHPERAVSKVCGLTDGIKFFAELKGEIL